MTKKTKNQEPQTSEADKDKILMELEDLTERWVELLEQSAVTSLSFHIATPDGYIEEYVELTHTGAFEPRRVLVEFHT